MRPLSLAIPLVAITPVAVLTEHTAACAGDIGPRPIIDAARYFSPESATSGLQETIDAIGPEGGMVVIPPGVYPSSGASSCGAGSRCAAAARPRCSAGDWQWQAHWRPIARTRVIEIAVNDSAGFHVGSAIALRDREQVGWYITHAIVKEVRPGRSSRRHRHLSPMGGHHARS